MAFQALYTHSQSIQPKFFWLFIWFMTYFLYRKEMEERGHLSSFGTNIIFDQTLLETFTVKETIQQRVSFQLTDIFSTK